MLASLPAHPSRGWLGDSAEEPTQNTGGTPRAHRGVEAEPCVPAAPESGHDGAGRSDERCFGPAGRAILVQALQPRRREAGQVHRVLAAGGADLQEQGGLGSQQEVRGGHGEEDCKPQCNRGPQVERQILGRLRGDIGWWLLAAFPCIFP